eukprot:TRINITY_DN37856_c0_g3_i1.p1 TRINITY_DN37856_c0_g3~~TRINITY_DN37856_c0_g3_i1.p1  ORF type:complete len:213 (+),score=19.27 TRINITY_DN37856_c0_g3_i1:40-678(+)
MWCAPDMMNCAVTHMDFDLVHRSFEHLQPGWISAGTSDAVWPIALIAGVAGVLLLLLFLALWHRRSTCRSVGPLRQCRAPATVQMHESSTAANFDVFASGPRLTPPPALMPPCPSPRDPCTLSSDLSGPLSCTARRESRRAEEFEESDRLHNQPDENAADALAALTNIHELAHAILIDSSDVLQTEHVLHTTPVFPAISAGSRPGGPSSQQK